MKIILSDQLKRSLLSRFTKYFHIALIAFIGYISDLIFGKFPYGSDTHVIWKFILCFIQGIPFFLCFIGVKVIIVFFKNNISIRWK